MNTRIFLAMTTCFAVSLSAQQAQSKGKMGGGMMDHMAEHMAEMKGEHRDMAQLMAKITQSFSAIQQEKNSAALAKLMTEHGALLKELQTKVEAGSKMMENMEKEDSAAPAAEHKH